MIREGVKTYKVLLLCLTSAFLLTGCGQAKEEIAGQVSSLAGTVKEKVADTVTDHVASALGGKEDRTESDADASSAAGESVENKAGSEETADAAATKDGDSGNGDKASKMDPEDGGLVGCDSMKEAEDLAGFSMSAPKAYGSFGVRDIAAAKDSMIQVTYKDEAGNQGLVVRKGLGDGDISGDASQYAFDQQTNVGGLTLRLRGDGENLAVVSWTVDGYSYSVNAAEAPVSMGDMMDFVRQMIAHLS